MVSSCFSCVFFPAYVFLWKLVHAEARACGHGKTQEKTSFLAFCTAPLPSLRLLPMLDMSPSLSRFQPNEEEGVSRLQAHGQGFVPLSAPHASRQEVVCYRK